MIQGCQFLLHFFNFATKPLRGHYYPAIVTNKEISTTQQNNPFYLPGPRKQCRDLPCRSSSSFFPSPHPPLLFYYMHHLDEHSSVSSK
mmetsp:Transcript_27984/g.46073  ORF Transcript_27984/g.46073 Transcript_27984/m.46073 type:complete len:88 (+) Transcript_27984:122-385(+)